MPAVREEPRHISIAERDQLCAENMDWAHGVVRKLYGGAVAEHAHIGLLHAVNVFDPSRGIPFRRYAVRTICRACIAEARCDLSRIDTEPIHEGTADISVKPKAPNTASEQLQALLCRMEDYRDPVRIIGFMRFIGGFKPAAIARTLNISIDQVNRAIPLVQRTL